MAFAATKTRRKFFAGIVLAGGILIATLIFVSGTKDTDKTPPLSATKSRTTNPALAFRKGTNHSLTAPAINEPPAQNLTDLLAESYLEEVVRKNPAGPQRVNGKKTLVLPSEEIFAEALAKTKKEIGPSKLFGENDIKIINDASRAAELAYLENLNKINQKNFGEFKKSIIEILDEWITNQNGKLLEKYVSLIPAQIQDLLSLPTPIRWKQFHLQNLNLWQKKLAVYSALLNLRNDPLASLLALEQVSPVIEETMILDDTLEERFNELNKKT
jgi:hypothetical protein